MLYFHYNEHSLVQWIIIDSLFYLYFQAQDSDDEDKYADDLDMPGQKFETKQRITVRNLRIREDTAKVILQSFFGIKIDAVYISEC